MRLYLETVYWLLRDAGILSLAVVILLLSVALLAAALTWHGRR